MASDIITVRAVADETPSTTWGIKYPVPLQHSNVRQTCQPLHFYYQKENQMSCQMLDCNTFLNEEGFTINYDEEHLLFPDCNSGHLMIYPATVKNGSVTFDTTNMPVFMCFNIRLTAPGMSLNVGPHTPLSLLLHLAQFHVVKLMLTKEQIVELSGPVKTDMYTC
jgi:hypothetical protein